MPMTTPPGITRALACVVLLLLMAGCGTRYATVRTDRGEDLMLLGHDPVAYFTVGKAVRGYPDIQAQYEGVTYYFASAENRRLFTAAPAKYAPQYGGFCADGAAYGVKLGSDPTEFAIRDGRLFIFGDVVGREFWLLRPEWDIEKADLMWPETGSRGHIAQSLYRSPCAFPGTRPAARSWASGVPSIRARRWTSTPAACSPTCSSSTRAGVRAKAPGSPRSASPAWTPVRPRARAR